MSEELKIKILQQQLKNEIELRQKMQERLFHAEKLASIGLLAGNLAHEIHNPLAFVMSSVQTLKDEINHLPLTAEDNHELIELTADIERGLQQVHGITTNYKSQLNQSKQIMEPLDISTPIEGAISMFKSANNSSIEVICNNLDQEQQIKGCATRLQQLFLNLFINAAQACEDDGQIKVNCHTHSQDGKESILVTVEDNGSGMEPNTLVQIFEPFFTTKDAQTGTGLGLAICQTIVEEHKASIEVNSQVGQGTCFTLTFPSISE
ncbi:HAMP domain-containing sensor histidine kinase [Vibrio sp. SCSIO 43136]|uniref:sensor histidine kinase n=1 Tax=Vibrio sp. SCSIO 43136 TaxID=2819101 RepID=UPI002074C4F2|nr:HAMP domain-containing sensor histidine kinase [Vibrio sp. SCSIO 43136]USD66785.1 HAMP domain-containing histidine kinase [Vibrio sp. SCSIO 43136]